MRGRRFEGSRLSNQAMTVCAQCGLSNAELARFCSGCGAQLARRDSHRADYAGFWQRAAAFFIDWFLLAVAAALLSSIWAGPGMLLAILLPWLYEALMLSGEQRATVGKIALGVVVTDVHGGRLTFGRATGRHFAKYLSGFFFGIGFFMAAFTAQKQALHDLLAHTLVLSQRELQAVSNR